MTNVNLDLWGSTAISVETTGEPLTVDRWKQELSQKLKELGKAVNEFERAYDKLSHYVELDRCTVNKISAVEEVIDSWVVEKCQEFTRLANNESHLEITPNRLREEFRGSRFPQSTGLYSPDPEIKKGRSIVDAGLMELVTYALDHYDFVGLEQALIKASAGLEAEGFKAAANTLAEKLELANLSGNASRTLQIKKQKGRYILEVSYYGEFAFQRLADIEAMIPSAKTFEMETGVSGLRCCLRAIIEAESKATARYVYALMPSRTKICSGENIEVVFFNRKLRFHFLPEVFEALIGFIQNYAELALIKLEVE